MDDSTIQSCPIPRWEILKKLLKNLDAEAFEAMRQAHPDYRLIDVRTPAEYAEFHLPDAQLLDYLGPDFLDDMEALDPKATYLVYCRTGRRSVRACTLMTNHGLEHLYHLDGGLQAWMEKFNH
ncbi:MAG: rhodanese-like domain-containing protein [Bacteroidota bacterium]